MKKILATVFSAALALSPLSVMAADNVTPSAVYSAPTVAEVQVENTTLQEAIDSDTVKVVITSAADAAEALPEIQEKLDSAYEQITSAPLEETLPDLVTVAEDQGLNVEDLVVTDIFDISLVLDDTTVIDENGRMVFTMEIPGVTSDQFLLYHNVETDTWELVPATYNEDGTVTFAVSSLSPFVVVQARTEEEPVNPETPVTPEKPETPVTPEKPETPVTPEKPETPVKPGTEPGKPSKPSTNTTTTNTGTTTTSSTNTGSSSAASSSTATGGSVATASESNRGLFMTALVASGLGMILLIKARKVFAK